MRALVVYFSVTGTTEKVAARIAEGLAAAGAEATMHDLRTGPAPDPRAFDLFGIGFPVHWYRMPTPVRDAFRAMGDLNGLPAFVFTLSATYRGAALNQARRALTRAGASEVGVFACRGEGRFFGYSLLGYQFSPGHPDPDELAAAERFGQALAARDVANPPVPSDPPTHWVYALERMAAAPPLARALYSRGFSSDEGLCTKCGRCARICPSSNITWSKGAVPTWGRECIMCLMCAEVCPVGAVASPIEWSVFRPFLRYNVRRAARDGEIPWKHVDSARGTLLGTIRSWDEQED